MTSGRTVGRVFSGLVAFALLGISGAAAFASGGYLSSFSDIRKVASTVPGDGDVNPYGLVVVPRSIGRLHAGDLLISNFNNSANQQGTGTTLVQIGPNGGRVLFARIQAGTLPATCPGGIGLTTALVALKSGWVIVGSLPTTDGTGPTARSGCLLVLDPSGTVREVITGHGINGPWDATAADHGSSADLFVTNVLNGTVAAGGATVDRGTVLRLHLSLTGAMPRVTSATVIGSGFDERTDPAALVIGPTGVGLSGTTLYVADTLRSRIAAIPNALARMTSDGTGMTVSTGGALNGPLGLVIAPNGDVLTVNSGNGVAVEVGPAGAQVVTRVLDHSGSPPGAGALFGLAVAPGGRGLYYVDDAINTLNLLH